MRDKSSLAYSINSGCEFFQDSGYIYIFTGVDKDSLFKNKNLNTEKGALFIIFRELKKLKNKGISSKELKKSKQNILCSLILKQENNSSINEFYGYQMAYLKKKILSLKDIEKIIKSITLKEVNNECKKLFNLNNANIQIIGNYSEKKVKKYIKQLI